MDHDLDQLFISLGLTLSAGQIDAFRIYENELLSWNEKFNLTAIRDRDGIRVKHFLDSLTCLKAYPQLIDQYVIDVGTGAGFPGIPLKIVCPAIRLTLVESIGKKAEFCRHMTDVLGLKGVEVLTLRAEEVGRLPAHREKYDVALARAVAALPVLTEYLLPLVKPGGMMVAQKGDNAPEEAAFSKNAISLLGGQLGQLIPVSLPGITGDRYLVVIMKISPTPAQYPRAIGIPQKKPL